MNHLATFKSAWESDQFIQIELEPVNINEVLAARYDCSPQSHMTKSQLWDMEVRKANRPDLYIPSVIKSGSAKAWGKTTNEHVDTFIRVSEQKLWLDENEYTTVIENVHVDHKNQMVTFIGEAQATSEFDGEYTSQGKQPIFHVQHGVVGEESLPKNTWRIVHLSNDKEAEVNQRFREKNNNPWLPEYIEIYLRNIVGLELKRNIK